MTLRPIDDLTWLYHDSATEVGVRSSMGSQVAMLLMGSASPRLGQDALATELYPTWVSPPVPTPKARRAGAKQARILRALRTLAPTQRHVIHLAYYPRDWKAPETLSEFGIATGVVTWWELRVRAEGRKPTEADADLAVQWLADAHAAYLRSAAGDIDGPRRRHRERAQVWVRGLEG